jgi:glucose/arabinose dehydrogenase
MSGLDNPRGLAFGPQGALYVAEAGRGDIGEGDGPCAVPPGGTTQVCYGATGAVSRLWHGVQERVATGLPSYATAAGRAQGPNDISMLGPGRADVTIGLETDPFFRDQLAVDQPEWAGFGRLVQISAGGPWRFVADLGTFEELANPDYLTVDSDPYGLLAVPGGALVADAGGNDLVRVDANGDVSLVAVLPPVPQANDHNPVPTSVVLGPDGAYYVGELTGAPFRDGSATIYRVVPGHEPEVYLSGFKAVIDLAFDSQGNLYVLQHATGQTMLMGPGELIRVAPDGTRTTVIAGLNRPTSVAVGPDGALYVTNHGLSVGGGEVLRIEP